MKLLPYSRRVFYYETDQMGIVHHSNYIRWLEEARLFALDHSGVNYRTMEEQGVMIPVVGVSCHYRVPTLYDETIRIETKLTYFNGIRMTFSYQIFSADRNILLADGESEHCFIDRQSRKPLNLRRRLPEFYHAIAALSDDAAEEIRR